MSAFHKGQVMLSRRETLTRVSSVIPSRRSSLRASHTFSLSCQPEANTHDYQFYTPFNSISKSNLDGSKIKIIYSTSNYNNHFTLYCLINSNIIIILVLIYYVFQPYCTQTILVYRLFIYEKKIIFSEIYIWLISYFQISFLSIYLKRVVNKQTR